MKNSLIVENRLAAAVKIILLSASFFIFWSALALISSVFHPLSTLWSSTMVNGPSRTLADSLYQEVIRSYFSLFTISVLVIFLLAGFLGYFWSRQASDKLFPFHENQNLFFVLIKRFFSTTPHTPLDFSNHDAIKRFNDSGNQIYGPAKILIERGAMVLVSKGMDDFRLMISNDPTPIQILPRERLIRILPSQQNEFIVDLVNPTSSDFFKSIQLRYSFRLHDLTENISRSEMLFFMSNGLSHWKEFINSIIQLEFDSQVKIECESEKVFASLNGQGKSGDNEKEESLSLPHSKYFSGKPLIKSKLTRNRKRGIYPLPPSDPEFLDELEPIQATMEQVQPILNKFLENFNRTTIQLFGFNPIKIIDYKIGEEK